ncbi:cellular morphogenesis protein [Diplodia corticola]|uniref:Cellular morphogenesis protein n=1 Tax=Diplodia corticola TaxID=236234 RepID=A0A1J9R7M1_9PEZI|nr:cellular morphogenesis protein [Diplodia corticola]OJD36584.1 cellular morphogenesis protein [Diplodia corticola]
MPKRKRSDEPSASNLNSSSSGSGSGSDSAHHQTATRTTKKNKKNATTTTTSSSSPSTAKQRKQLPPRLEQAKKQLTKALKVARGFERQKLSRRRKAATDKNNSKNEGDGNDDAAAVAIKRIDGEIEALKRIDYAKLAERHLYKTLLRIKSVREHGALPPWVVVVEGAEGAGVMKKKVEEGGKEGGEEAAAAARQAGGMGKEAMNVQARLFNAGPTKEAMAEVVRDVRAILGLDDGGSLRKKEMKKGRGEGEEKAGRGKKAAAAAAKVEEEVESADDDDDESEASAAEGEGEWDSEEFAGFSDRIAASSDEESEEEGVEVRLQKGPYQPVRDLSFTPPSSREASPSASSEPTFSDEEEDESPEPDAKAKSKEKEKEKAPVVANKSTFLPSLSAVGYISGSDSEAEDLDEQIAPQKKNRRGQRARQQLWEKKFGKGAKHLAKQNEKQKKDRNAGWDAKRGAVDGAGGRGKKGKFGRDKGGFSSGGRGPQASDANLVELGKKKNHRDDGGKLHPSWEAAKLAKEKAKLVNVQFQGKKITFD